MPCAPTQGGSLEEVGLHQLSEVDFHPANLEAHFGDAIPQTPNPEDEGLHQANLVDPFVDTDLVREKF